MVVKAIIYSVLICFGLVSTASSQNNINFYSEVNPKSGTIKDSYLFSVVVENASRRVTPEIRGGEDFNVQLLGPSQSTTIINGEVSTELSLRYELKPKREGQLNTPSAEVEINGKIYKADAISVQVSSAPVSDKETDNDGVLLLQELSKQNAFVGEQVVETLTLLSQTSLYDPKFSDPLFDGFWSEDIGEPSKSNVIRNGQHYTAFKWNKALYPTKTGKIELQARRLEYKSAKKSRKTRFGGMDPFDDPFDSFFGGMQYEENSVDSNSASIEVNKLPSPPADFKNWKVQNILVGETKLSLQYQADAIKTGDSKTLQLNIESLGNLQPFTELPLEGNEDYRVYKEAAEDRKIGFSDQLKMRKKISFSIVPLRPGKFHIAPITLGYFDPSTQTYKEASTQAIDFDVNGEDLRSKKSVEKTEGQEIKQTPLATAPPVPAETIELYKEESLWQKFTKKISASMLLLSVSILLLLIIVINFLISIRSKNLPLKENLKKIESASSVSELSQIFRQLLVFQLKIREGNSYGESLRAEIKRNISDSELVFKIQSILDDFDSKLYGINSTLIDLDRLKKEVAAIIRFLR